VANNTMAGAFIFGARVTALQTVFRGNQPSPNTGPQKELWGGYGLVTSPVIGGIKWPSQVTVRECAFLNNSDSGVQFETATAATMERTLVRSTRKAGEKHGDGVALLPTAQVSIRDCEIDQSGRTGVLFWDAGGLVNRTLIRRGAIPIAISGAAAPTIAEDNEFRDNQDNKISTGSNVSIHKVPEIPLPGIP
jgi:hypothetical protein